jgi:hypothetical protein
MPECEDSALLMLKPVIPSRLHPPRNLTNYFPKFHHIITYLPTSRCSKLMVFQDSSGCMLRPHNSIHMSSLSESPYIYCPTNIACSSTLSDIPHNSSFLRESKCYLEHLGHAVTQLVETLIYNPAGHGLDSR